MKEIQDIFSIGGKTERLSGGQGQSVRVGDFVVKPIEETEKYSWAGSVLESLPTHSLAIAKPIRSKNGNFVENGYGATHYIAAEFSSGRISEKISACQLLNQLLENIEQPEQWNSWYSPWQWANQVAWEENHLPQNANAHSIKVIEEIKSRYKLINLTKQLIHSDLAGNILFDGPKPVVIDFSPEFRPSAYAEILLITDSIAWHNEPTESLWLTQHKKELVIQLALRAIVFRLSVIINLYPTNHEAFQKELKNFQPLLNVLID